MSRRRFWLATAALVILGLVASMGLPLGTMGTPAPAFAQDSSTAPDLPTDNVVARVYYDAPGQLRLLGNYDIWEHDRKQGFVIIGGLDAADVLRLNDMGFRVEVDERRTLEMNLPRFSLPGQLSGIPGYPCYRTVEETFATAEDIVLNHPNLATWIDVGDSWEKTEPGGLPGYDMMVLRLTNSAVGGDKPKLFVTSSIHAREYAPAELITRFAEYLVTNYDVDPDVTWILDYHEIHLMLQANPDGRKQAETGLLWRKNTNQNYCSPTSNNRGADLNRNFEFQWGCCGGSSGSPCASTYRGPSPASEPEVQAIQAYGRSIFPDQRPDPPNVPAPDDATGVYLDVHSYGDLVLWPWGYTYDPAPNGTALQTLGRKFAYFNGYEPDQAIGLYPTDGTTDDFFYGDLGVAGYTFELGTTFFQSCSYFENTIIPENMPALLYAAKAPRTPYLTPAGPDVVNVAVGPALEAVDLTATVDDSRFSSANGVEPTQNVVAAEYYVDVPPWDTANGPVAVPMQAADGNFDSPVEDVVAAVDTSALAPGRHTLFVRGRDASGNWGPVSAAFIQATSACRDFNGNGRVDIGDVQLVAGAWESTLHPQYDFNGNGVIDAGDIQVVADDWNTVCGS